jgi:hypothetical protein
MHGNKIKISRSNEACDCNSNFCLHMFHSTLANALAFSEVLHMKSCLRDDGSHTRQIVKLEIIREQKKYKKYKNINI